MLTFKFGGEGGIIRGFAAHPFGANAAVQLCSAAANAAWSNPRSAQTLANGTALFNVFLSTRLRPLNKSVPFVVAVAIQSIALAITDFR